MGRSWGQIDSSLLPYNFPTAVLTNSTRCFMAVMSSWTCLTNLLVANWLRTAAKSLAASSGVPSWPKPVCETSPNSFFASFEEKGGETGITGAGPVVCGWPCQHWTCPRFLSIQIAATLNSSATPGYGPLHKDGWIRPKSWG